MCSTATDFVPPPPTRLRQAVPELPFLFGFQTLNAISFQIVLGPPIILLARKWGASAFYIGALTSLVPLLATLQLYMAPRVEHIGFRRVMLSGWTGRNIALIFTATLPFLTRWIPYRFLLEALFAFMVIYNVLRGVASASWMPWLQHLVPGDWRGRYVSAEQFVINLSSASAFFFCGWMLGNAPDDADFGLLMLIALVTGWTSLYFMNSIQSPPVKPGKPLIRPVWQWAREVWRHRPTRRLIQMNIVWSLGMAAWGTFTVIFMRDRLHFTDQSILYITGTSTLGSVISSWMWGTLSDRFGSRPVLALSTRLLVVLMICWLLLALELWPPSLTIVLVLYVLNGVAVIGFTVANARYLFNNADPAAPVLAISLFSVAASLANGAAPLLWGAFLRIFAAVDHQISIFHFTNFTWFYLLSLGLVIGCKALIRRMPDSGAAAPHLVLYHIINDLPLRAFNGIYALLFSRENGR